MGGKGAAGWGSLLSGTYFWPTVTLLTTAAQITPSKSFKLFKQTREEHKIRTESLYLTSQKEWCIVGMTTPALTVHIIIMRLHG